TEVSQMGTHHVIFGAVAAIRSGAGKPLLHANRTYCRLSA
ncbi:MAG: flavin reductase, partial [Devosia nanyangense]|nr:flavin reductase [Devosia nanyangense]